MKMRETSRAQDKKLVVNNFLDYYDNADNEGEIFFQIINLSPFDIQLKKGDRIGQGTILSYGRVSKEENIDTVRTGGFGSTEK